jgi:hypothetical protein
VESGRWADASKSAMKLKIKRKKKRKVKDKKIYIILIYRKIWREADVGCFCIEKKMVYFLKLFLKIKK